MSIVILNGPNLNMLGIREPEIYGTESLDDIKNWLVDESGIDFQWFQSNSEGDLIDQIQTSQLEKTDIVINPGAFTHYSYGLHDALSSHKAAGLVSIECHLSNPAARESFRQKQRDFAGCYRNHRRFWKKCLSTSTARNQIKKRQLVGNKQ